MINGGPKSPVREAIDACAAALAGPLVEWPIVNVVPPIRSGLLPRILGVAMSKICSKVHQYRVEWFDQAMADLVIIRLNLFPELLLGKLSFWSCIRDVFPFVGGEFVKVKGPCHQLNFLLHLVDLVLFLPLDLLVQFRIQKFKDEL
jgi:hypothetical protein